MSDACRYCSYHGYTHQRQFWKPALASQNIHQLPHRVGAIKRSSLWEARLTESIIIIITITIMTVYTHTMQIFRSKELFLPALSLLSPTISSQVSLWLFACTPERILEEEVAENNSKLLPCVSASSHKLYGCLLCQTSEICMIENAWGILIVCKRAKHSHQTQSTLQRNLWSCKHWIWQNTALAAAAVTNIQFIRLAKENIAWNVTLINSSKPGSLHVLFGQIRII